MNSNKNQRPCDDGMVNTLHNFIIPVIRARIWWIIVVPFVVGVLAGLSTYLMGEVYRSSAKLIVVPPKYREEQTLLPEQFSMKTYESLLNSSELAYELLQYLKLSKRTITALQSKYPDQDWTIKSDEREFLADGYRFAVSLSAPEIAGIVGCTTPQAEFMAGRPAQANQPSLEGFSAHDWVGAAQFKIEALEEAKLEMFQKSIHVDLLVEEDTPYGTTYSPVLTIAADAGTPKGAKLKTDILANIFLERARLITSMNTKDTVDAISEGFIQAASDVLRAGQAIQQYKQANPLELIEKEIEAKNQILLGGAEQYRDPTTGEMVYQPSAVAEYKQVERLIEKKKNTIKRLKEELGILADNGDWIGTLDSTNDITVDYQETKAQIQQAISEENILALNVLRSKRNLLKAMIDLNDFVSKTQLEIEQQRLQNELQTLDILRQDYAQTEMKAKSLAQQLVKLTEMKGQIKQVIELKDEVPFEAILSLMEKAQTAQQLQQIGEFSINREALTPEYESLGAEMVLVESELSAVDAKLTEQQRIIDSKQQLVRELNSNVSRWNEQKTALVNSLEALQEAHQEQLKQYIETLDLYQNTTRELERDIAVVTGLEQKVNEFTEEIEGLMDQAEKMRVELEDLERREESLKEAFALVSDRYKEAQMERSSTIQDVRLVGEPVEPDLRLKPKRRNIAMMAFAFSFAAILFLVLVADRLRIYPVT